MEMSCFDCRFYDGICCLYKCKVLAIRDEEVTASKCKHYSVGEFSWKGLEESDYE